MTSPGDRMKLYERAARAYLPPRSYAIVRVDGRAFHTHLRGAERPFDDHVASAMNAVAVRLCSDIQGAVLAYTQSDECSVLFTDLNGSVHAEQWFGGVVQKIVSVSASLATAEFNYEYIHPRRRLAVFDARVFVLPDRAEVARYFVWRQLDAIRNSISMAAQAKFSHAQLHRANAAQQQEMLRINCGIDWNDYPAGHRRGRICVRESGERETSYIDGRTGKKVTATTVRSWWAAQDAPAFNFDSDGLLNTEIPASNDPFGQTGKDT